MESEIKKPTIEELLKENDRLKMILQMKEQKISQLTLELEDKEYKRLKMMINVRDNKISELQVAYKEQIDYEQKRRELDQEIQAFAPKRISAYYYETLMEIIKENEFLQSEWVKFMTYVKLTADTEEVKRLGG